MRCQIQATSSQLSSSFFSLLLFLCFDSLTAFFLGGWGGGRGRKTRGMDMGKVDGQDSLVGRNR